MGDLTICGIAAAAGDFPPSFLHDALKAVEYRGYDSWGMGWTKEGEKGWKIHKANGAPSDHPPVKAEGVAGIAHTRWATHGEVCPENTHPVVGSWGGVAGLLLACNGVVENASGLAHPNWMKGDTDTEALAHFLVSELAGAHPVNFARVIAEACKKVKGKFAFALIHRAIPDMVFLYARGAPMLVGKEMTEDGIAATYAASDQAALLCCDHYYALKDGQVGVLKAHDIDIYQDGQWYDVVCDGEVVRKEAGMKSQLMAGEIAEQARPFSTTSQFPPPPSCREAVLYGCGSSYNAAMWGRCAFEGAGVKARAEYATELSDARLATWGDQSYFALTQSGETRDTLDVLERLKEMGEECSYVLTANPNSAAGRLCQALDIGCGPERAVAATKSFTAQCVALARIASRFLPNNLGLGGAWQEKLAEEIAAVLSREAEIKALTDGCPQHVFFLGSGPLYPIAREGALKLKEVAYVHAEAMPASEVKHGPLALVDNETLAIFLMDGDNPRVAANIEEIKARGGRTLLVGTTDTAARPCSSFLHPSSLPPILRGLVLNVALQLFAMHVALKRGLNPDRPRSLAKAISV